MFSLRPEPIDQAAEEFVQAEKVSSYVYWVFTEVDIKATFLLFFTDLVKKKQSI